MTTRRLSGLAGRVGEFFGSQQGWERPTPASLRSDLWIGLAFWAVAAVVTELGRLMGLIDHAMAPLWARHLAVATGTLVLVARRRFPLAVALWGGLHMFVVGVTMPAVMASFPLQVAYFLTLFSAVAWARDRQQMTVVVGLVVALMLLWVALAMALGTELERYARLEGPSLGPITPAVAAGAYIFLVNLAYFGGAVLLGQRSWIAARHTAELAQQREQLADQAERLRDQALVAERLRIARELHDVVAHHVSVMGVQAGAARTVMPHDPARAQQALRAVEESSREAVAQLRGLLGTLRHHAVEPAGAAEAVGTGMPSARDGAVGDPGGGPLGTLGGAAEGLDRTPAPGLRDLPALVAASSAGGLTTSYELVESGAAAADVPDSLGLAIYRIVQESLTNVRRHSSARAASVVVRVQEGFVEAEVLDNGRPLGPSTGGSGLGLLGVRERIRSFGGFADIGPRVTGGYRVRVRFPLRAVGGLTALSRNEVGA